MKNIAILAILGYISGTEAVQIQYDKDDANKDISTIKTTMKGISTKVVKLETWINSTKKTDTNDKKDDKKEEKKDEKKEDKKDEKKDDKDDSGLPWITQK